MIISRFAPSTTGDAHPGTLMAALLAWLDARSLQAHLILRYEDLDPNRAKPEFFDAIRFALEWLGLDWDEEMKQSDHVEAYAAAMDRLQMSGRLYVCDCSRSHIKAHGQRSPEGGWRYPNHCRQKRVREDWRDTTGAIRCRIDDKEVRIQDQNGEIIRQRPSLEVGDPVVRRQDGSLSYHFSNVFDDTQAKVSRIVRGRDLAPTTPTQWLLRELLGGPHPTYHHHLLFLQSQGNKFAKFHGAVGLGELRQHYQPENLIGFIAHAIGLQKESESISAAALLPRFKWDTVVKEDVLLKYENRALHLCRDDATPKS